MVLDNEDQRAVLLEALTKVQITGTYETIAQMWPLIEATVAAVKNATIKEEVTDG